MVNRRLEAALEYANRGNVALKGKAHLDFRTRWNNMQKKFAVISKSYDLNKIQLVERRK